MAAGVVGGAALIAVMNGVPLYRLRALPRPNLDFAHPGVREVLRLYGPIFAGLVVSAIAVIVYRNLAWRAEEDALGAMRYATTLVQFVLGLVAAAISLAALPSLSGHFTNGDEPAFWRTLERALIMTTILIVPCVLGLAALSEPVVNLLFKHGATDGSDARLIVIALLGYLPGTLFAAYDQILIYAFYARKNTWRPVLVGIAATLVYFAVALSLSGSLGMKGLVFANSAQFIAHAAIMYWLIRRELASDWRAIGRVMARCGAAGVVTAAASLALWLAFDRMLPAGKSTISETVVELLLAGVPAALGAAVYLVALHALRVDEATELRRMVLAKLRP
jgi:putative peptidoglycan lipid II flippase